jgi:protein ImuB
VPDAFVPSSLRAFPLVLVRTVATRQLIIAASEAARAVAIRPGMMLGEARALCATVESEEHDPVRDAKSLEALARWMMRFSPVVSLKREDVKREKGSSSRLHVLRFMSDYGLFLDLTGCDRVFGSIQNIVDRIRAALARMRITAAVAVGSTPGAAWTLSFSQHAQPRHPERSEGSCRTDQILRCAQDDGSSAWGSDFNHLPVVSLRLDPDIVESLHHLGLDTIGQLLRLPRELLPARFGPVLSLRLDQLLGHVHEPLVPLEYLAPICARMDFDGLVESLEAIWIVFKELIGQIVGQLSRHGRGAREIEIDFYRAYAQTIRMSVRLSRPSRDPVNLFNLLRCAMETIETDEGFLGIQLTVIASERISEEQITLLGGEEFAGEIELSHLIERLFIRLGQQSIAQPQLVESHIPELASSWHGQLARAPKKRTTEGTENTEIKNIETADARRLTQIKNQNPNLRPSASLCGSNSSSVSSVLCVVAFDAHTSERFTTEARVENPCHEMRPLHLLPRPREILVMVSPSDDREGRPVSFTHDGNMHRIVHTVGPERVAGQWWEGHHRTRDYFDVEDDTGERFWIFRVRESGRWFLHGEFE